MSSVGAPIYSSLSSDPVMCELVAELVNKLPERIEQLKRQMEEQDLEALASSVHQLKGACGGYGFEPLSEEAARVEYSIKSGIALDQVVEQLDGLIEMLGRATADRPAS